jgi:hypothetical protein
MIEFDYQSRTFFDWKPYAEGPMPATEHLNREQARQMAERMQDAWNYA